MELVSLVPSTLYIVSTPIGNPKDITIRALEVLKQVDVILAEDTRVTLSLLTYYGIKDKKLISFHSHNEKEKINIVYQYFFNQMSVALVSDAGTPLISDPGNLLVKSLIQREINIISIPGVSSFTTLLPLTGFSLQEFLFRGFLSHKSSKRRNQMQELFQYKTVLIFFEAPHRIKEFLEDLSSIFGEQCEIVIGRELTKSFETIYRGTISIIFNLIHDNLFIFKGEFCIIINNTKYILH